MTLEHARATAGLEDDPAEDAVGITVWEPQDGDHLWVFPESQDRLGSGGEFHIYLDPKTRRTAKASFARFSLGVGGDLSEHRHDKTEEMGYLVSGEGALKRRQNGELDEVPLRAGSAWYIPPGAWHALKNTGSDPLVLIFASIPNVAKGLLSFFRRIATTPGQEPNRITKEELVSIGLEHDFVLRTS